MKKKQSTAIGFVGTNTGTITNSYSSLKLHAKKASGFCERNTGKIEHCFSNCKIKAKHTYGFSQDASGGSNVTHSFYNIDKIKKNKRHDNDSGVSLTQVTGKFYKENEWDLIKTWKINDETNLPVFNKTNYFADNYYDEKENTHEKLPDVIKISCKEDLIRFRDFVNANNESYRYGRFILTCNIDLEGMNWIPIGKEDALPFCGEFDGNGYKIKNFYIKDKNLEYAGFFGVCKNARIINLRLDCEINAKSVIGGFVTINEESEIIGCSIAVNIKLKETAAAFVYKNSGKIDRCYAVGKVSLPLIVILLPVLIPILSVAVLAAIAGYIFLPNKNVFPTIQPDPNAVPISGDSVDGTGENSVTLNYKKKVIAQTGEGNATMYFASPQGNHINQYVVVRLQLTDAELISKIGKTGRTKIEQLKYDMLPDYDTEACRVEVGCSGAIAPGYQLSSITINKLPDGTVLPAGDYHAILYFDFYDKDTNTKSSVSSQSAAILTVLG